MKKKISNLAMIGIVILLAELLNAFFLLVMEKYKSSHMPYRSTAVQMIASLIIYYPVFTFMEKYFKDGSKQLMSNTKKVAKNHIGGVILAFILVFFICWIALVRIWYDRNLFGDLFHWIGKAI